MKQFAGIALIAAFVLMPSIASAHETQVFEIGGKMYQFVVGSLNEPLVVDDKSGVELQVKDMGAHVEGMAHDEDGHDHGTGAPVTGLEDALQVELIAGTAKKTLDLAPIYGTPGAYKAPYYPTVATTLSYRVFGTLNKTPVDITFTCSPAGHTTAEEDNKEVEISEGVTRHEKSGAFGCPAEKGDMGFPEPSADVQTLKNGGGGLAMLAFAFSVIALIVALFANRKRA